MDIFHALATTIFAIINLGIIWSDIRDKKIPNRYLVGLATLALCTWVYYTVKSGHIWGSESLVALFLVALIVSFGLYSYGVWSAGDAKYLLILSLFVPDTGIIPLVGNIAILTIAHLGIHYVWFYGRFAFRERIYQSSFIENIWKTKWDAFLTFVRHPETEEIEIQHALYRIFKFFLVFLTVFVGMRLVRQYLVEDLRSLTWVADIFVHYPAYSIFGVGAVLFGSFIGIKRGLQKLNEVFSLFCKHRGWKIDLELVFAVMLFGALAIFIAYEYVRDPVDIRHRLFLIFTLYLALYAVFRMLYHSHIFVFHLSEQDMISIEKLQDGDIVDKPYLVKLFGSQIALGAVGNPGILSPDPQKYFESIENPIDHETVEALREIYRIVNEYHVAQKTPSFQKITAVKILKTFPFAIYIFLGFCMTYMWGDRAFRVLVTWGGELLKWMHS